MAWSDPFGHAQGKRIPASQFLDRALGSGFAFCEASLGWNTEGTVIDSLRLTNWVGGYPDVFAVPDLATYRPLPWRPRVGHVISDIVAHDRNPSLLDPRAVLKRVLARLAALGYTAKVGVEFEFYLLNPDGSPFQDDIHAYSLENANALDPLLTDLYETLSAFTRLEGIQTEYGPGQVETNLVYTDALEAADDSRSAQVRRQGGGPQARQARQLHAEAVHRTLGKLRAPAHLAVARRRTRLRAGRRRRERARPACDRGPARASAVDHVVRGALGQRLPAIRAGFVRAGDRDVEPRQPQRRGAFAGGGRPVGHPHRTAQRRLGRQPVLVDRLGVGGGDRGAGSASRRPRPPRAATSTPRVSRCPNRWAWQSNWPPRTTPSPRSWARIRCSTSPRWPAANGRSTPTQVSDWERRRYLARS